MRKRADGRPTCGSPTRGGADIRRGLCRETSARTCGGRCRCLIVPVIERRTVVVVQADGPAEVTGPPPRLQLGATLSRNHLPAVKAAATRITTCRACLPRRARALRASPEDTQTSLLSRDEARP